MFVKQNTAKDGPHVGPYVSNPSRFSLRPHRDLICDGESHSCQHKQACLTQSTCCLNQTWSEVTFLMPQTNYTILHPINLSR